MRSGSPSAGQGGRALRRACVPPYPVATAGGGGAQRLASYAHLEGEYAAARIVATATATLPPPAYEPPPRLVALSLRAYDGAFIYDLRHFLRQVPSLPFSRPSSKGGFSASCPCFPWRFVVRVRELELPFCSIKLCEEWDVDRINHVTACENTGFTVGNALRGPRRV